jgi:hypothetical protein
MPHSKRLDIGDDGFAAAWGENAAFSPDGLWFGPLKGADRQMDFIGADGKKMHIEMPDGVQSLGQQAIWSPDGSRVVLIGAGESRAVIVDITARTARVVQGVDPIPRIESWDHRKARWNPWSKDGQSLTFVKKGQVWTAAPDGSSARQLTFDSAK